MVVIPLKIKMAAIAQATRMPTERLILVPMGIGPPSRFFQRDFMDGKGPAGRQSGPQGKQPRLFYHKVRR